MVTDEHGVIRFKENNIVRFILDNSGINLNDIARKHFDNDDMQQFMQLIGYSLDGYAALSYTSMDVIQAADTMAEKGLSATEAENEILKLKLDTVRDALRSLATELFKIHPDDLQS